jgi:hypothetical protein
MAIVREGVLPDSGPTHEALAEPTLVEYFSKNVINAIFLLAA